MNHILVATVCMVCSPLYGGAQSSGAEISPVYFSLIISGGENGYRSSGGIPSIQLALDAVNKTELLPGYNLTYDSIRNSQVNMKVQPLCFDQLSYEGFPAV